MPDPKTYFAPEPETPPLEEGDDGGCGREDRSIYAWPRSGRFITPTIYEEMTANLSATLREEFRATLGAAWGVKFEQYQADQRRQRERQQSKQEDVS